jgi:protein TonB
VARAGPPAPSTAADTPLVDGSGPNGEKLYAAAWQREPSDGEMRGYLSTAQPGWGMIACGTVADFKVDDCVAVGESRGSQLVRAMLAAAWQFRVRPPRIGGRLQVGEWVRIRFDYGVRQRAAWEQNRD